MRSGGSLERLRRVDELSSSGAGVDAVRLAGVGQVIRDVPVGGEQVSPPVVVEVEESHAPAAACKAQQAEPARIRDIAKETSALVAEQGEGLALQRGHHDVGQTVAVVVPKIGAHA